MLTDEQLAAITVRLGRALHSGCLEEIERGAILRACSDCYYAYIYAKYPAFDWPTDAQWERVHRKKQAHAD